jgi:hypothetical protein
MLDSVLQKYTFSFCTSDLSARDETLLKSYIAIVNHSTKHNWVYQSANADLWILGLAEETLASVKEDSALSGVLKFCAVTSQRTESLSWPLRINELEALLNLMGDTVNCPGLNLHANSAFKLLQWPEARLLRTRDSVRLATLLTGAPVSLTKLQEKSGLEKHICTQFLKCLKQVGNLLVIESPPILSVSESPVTQKKHHKHTAGGLLARIHRRIRQLGF